jgi:hypothetical protein
MFAIYVSTIYDKMTVKTMLEEYLYSKYNYLPQNIIHSIDVAFPRFNNGSYIVVLAIEPEMVPEFNRELYQSVTVFPNLICQHPNVY